MTDIAPELIDSIKKTFAQEMANDHELAEKLKAVLEGSTHYSDALDLADRVGQCLQQAIKSGLTPGTLPEDTLFYNIAKRLIDDVGGNAYDIAAQAAEQVQDSINAAAGIGIKSVSAGTKESRLTDLVNAVAGRTLQEAMPKLTAAAQTLPLGAAGDTMKANADFQGKSGMQPKIVRTYRRGKHACEWCVALAGTYKYPNVPDNVYHRHENCRCTVEYDPGNKNVQDVWTKRWKSSTESDTINYRKTVGLNAANRKFKTQDLLQIHFQKHAAEYGDISIPEYLHQATMLAEESLSDDVVQLLRSDGSVSKYRFSTNDFLVINEDGTIRTFFKPEKREVYWKNELDRN